MNPIALSAVLLASTLLAADVPEKAIQQEFKALQGVWTVVDAEQDGQPLERIKGGTLTVKDVNFVIVTKGGTEMKGDLRLDPAKKPKEMDLAHQMGLLRDKTWLAIYTLDGDDLKICYVIPDANKERPGDFTTAENSGRLLITMKRTKP